MIYTLICSYKQTLAHLPFLMTRQFTEIPVIVLTMALRVQPRNLLR